MEDCNKLFSEVKFFMAQCNKHDEIKDILIGAGARHINYLSEQVTHVIADSNCPEAEEAVELYDKPVVTSLWVHLSIKAQRLLPAEAFSPNRQIFQNVIAAFSSELSNTDIDVLAATLTFYGGRLTKDLEHATHFLAVSTKPEELPKEQESPYKFRMIAPDWVLDSVKQKSCLDETPYEPGLLLGPPPPPPPKLPTPPPATIDPPKSNTDDSKTVTTPLGSAAPSSSTGQLDFNPTNIPPPNQDISPISQQRFGNQMQPQFDPNQQPRVRMVTPRGPRPGFRQILPPNHNMSQAPRQMIRAQPRMVMADSQQSRQLGSEYNTTFRKVAPYQIGSEVLPMHQQHAPHQQQQPIHTYQQAQHTSMHQQGQTSNQPNRLPQQNLYQQPRPPYQNNQMPPRLPMTQPNMISQQHMQPQTINRMQDPTTQMNQPRPYQMGMQSQPTGYQQANLQRQPIYYNQNQNMQIRMPQQAPPPRMILQSDHQSHDNFTQPIDNMHPQQQYQPVPQPVYQQHPRHQVPPQQQSQNQHRPQQFQQPHPPVVMQSRPQFQPTMPTTIRGPRGQIFNQQEVKAIRQPAERQPRGPRASSIQAQPHPSIFDPKQESSYAQMKAKVPILTDNIDYFDHSPGFKPQKYEPLKGCVFKIVEHTNVNPKLLTKWTDAIIDAGGRFSEDTEVLTHIICESRSTPMYSEAIKKGIRCVTIYWINDVMAEDKMTYPWKALHVPTPFMQDDRPLQNQIISITNFRGRERREVKEMIMKTGATSTDYFSQTNTLLICGSPGGEKYERAIEWGIPIANCQLLSDFLISGRDFSQMLAHAKYQNFNRGDQLRLDSYVLIRDLMTPWTKPVPLPIVKEEENIILTNGTPKTTPVVNPNEDSGMATGGSNNSDIESVKSKLEESKPPTQVEEVKKEVEVSSSDQLSLKQEQEQSTIESQGISTNTDLKALITNADVEMKFVDTCTVLEGGTVPTDDESKATAPQNVANKDIVMTNQIEVSKQAKNIDGDSVNTGNVVAPEKPFRTSDEPVRILFTHFEEKLQKQLESYALKLKLTLAASPLECTHLVVDRISRTPKFVCAFSHAKHILSHKWLIESHDRGQVLDERAFILQDSEGEKKFSFNLVYSLLKRKKRKSLLFTDFIFFVSPSVMASTKNLKEMIESAGGKITTRKLPTLAQLNQIRASNKRFVVITNRQDLHLCSSAEQLGADLLRVEFVISGILRQDIDMEAHRISLSQPVKTTSIESSAQNSIVAPSPNKKLRAD